jgi:hypothetical protein
MTVTAQLPTFSELRPISIRSLRIECTYDDDRFFVTYQWCDDQMKWMVDSNSGGSSEEGHRARLFVLEQVRERMSRGEYDDPR